MKCRVSVWPMEQDMSEADLPAREAMEFDVVIVGAGPAGLAAAIRLKQLSPDTSVVVVEKGSEVGAHILSGAVIDPIALDRLVPEWRNEDAPVRHRGDRGPLLFARALRRAAGAEPVHAAADEQSRQFHRLARRCLPLSRRKRPKPRRRNLSGLRRRRGAVRERRGRRHRHRRHGRRQGRSSQGELHPRHGAAGQIHAVRRGRARQPVQDVDRALWPRRKTGSRRNTASASRSCGRSRRSNSSPASSSTPWAGRLPTTPAAARFSIISATIWSSVGFVVHLNYQNPYLSPFEEFQRVQDPSAGARHLRGRQAHLLRRPRASPKAAGSRCRSLPLPVAR